MFRLPMSIPHPIPIPPQVRVYAGQPTCFLGGPHRAVLGELEQCSPTVAGWKPPDDDESGCKVLRCLPAPAVAQAEESIPFLVSLNGHFDSATLVATITYFDNDAVTVSLISAI